MIFSMQRLKGNLLIGLYKNSLKILFGRRFLGTEASEIPKDFLGSEFELQANWDSRLTEIKQAGIGNTSGYEWIVLVQKKFASNVKASAIDVDIAVNLSTESDQRNDLVDLVYKLRHSNNAGDLLPSTEYAIFRLLLKYQDWNNVFKINYGLFLNTHAACMYLNNLLKLENYSGAAKIATIMMQQEMFDNTLLNFLCIYSLAKFTELPEEQRVFDEEIQKKLIADEEDNEEEMGKRLNLRLRLEEIRKQREKLLDEKETLYFFENRGLWEEKAAANDQLFEELNLHKKEIEATEKEYAAELFENIRKITQGKYKAQTAKA